MTVFRPLIYVVISGVLYVDWIRGVRASVAESPRALAALLVGGDGNDMVGQASNLNQNTEAAQKVQSAKFAAHNIIDVYRYRYR